MAVDEVIIYREDERLVIEPVNATPSLADLLATLEPIDDEFPDPDDPPTKPERLL